MTSGQERAVVGDANRKLVLTVHGVGLVLVGAAFAVDAGRGLTPGRYVPAIVAGVLIVLGQVFGVRRLVVAGLCVAIGWYVVRGIALIHEWVDGAPAQLGRAAVYAFLLAPAAAGHLGNALAWGHDGRRQRQEGKAPDAQ